MSKKELKDWIYDIDTSINESLSEPRINLFVSGDRTKWRNKQLKRMSFLKGEYVKLLKGEQNV